VEERPFRAVKRWKQTPLPCAAGPCAAEGEARKKDERSEEGFPLVCPIPLMGHRLFGNTLVGVAVNGPRSHLMNGSKLSGGMRLIAGDEPIDYTSKHDASLQWTWSPK